MGRNHSEQWISRPTDSTGFGFAAVGAVNDAFGHAFARATDSTIHDLDVRIHQPVPIDRRYELSIVEEADGRLSASMHLDDVIVAEATASIYSST
jgi:hypothetical protein